MEIMVSVSEWLDMYLYALRVFAGMGLFTNEDNTDAPNLTKYKGLAEKLADYGIDDKQFYKLAGDGSEEPSDAGHSGARPKGSRRGV